MPMPKFKVRTVRIEEIIIDARAQTRADGIDEKHVAQMVDDVKELPPPLCIEVDGKILLADGFHRLRAYRAAKVIRIAVMVAVGTEDDWVDVFASANHDQKGKPRTVEDKKESVLRVLELRDNWTNTRIAEAAKVSEGYVRKLRKADPKDDGATRTYELPTTRETTDGRQYPATNANAKPKVTATPPVEVTPEPEPVAALETAPEPKPVSEPILAPAATEPTDTPEVDEAPTDDRPQILKFVADIEEWCRDADQMGQRLAALKALPFAYSVHFGSAIDNFKSARQTLWQGRPAHPCPYCGAAGELQPECRACKGHGYVKKTTYDAGVAAMEGFNK